MKRLLEGRTLDSEGRALRGLTQARENLLVQVSTNRLSNSDGRSRLSFSKRRGVDTSDDNVVTLRGIFETLEHRKVDLGLRLSVKFEFLFQDASLLSDLTDRQRGDGLRNLNVGGSRVDDVPQLVSHDVEASAL